MKTSLFVAAMMMAVVVSRSQDISIKTVPLSTGSQFLLFPSQTGAMGGVSLAVHDSLADPFVNPASGSLVQGVRLMSSPTYYSFSMVAGGGMGSIGRTLPLSILFHTKNYFGGLMWARQTLTPDQEEPAYVIPFSSSLPVTQNNAEDGSTNTYVQGLFGMEISGTGLSVGGSLFLADLSAVEGVQYLYPGAQGLRQRGTLSDYRIGLFWNLESARTWEVVISHHRTDMRQDVARWKMGGIEGSVDPSTELAWDRNLDQTSGYGMMTRFQQPISDQWDLGAQVVIDWKSLPKIPDYDLMNIPRDPGNSLAFNLGAGLHTKGKNAAFGFDIIYEPITSSTWAETESPITSRTGRVLDVGARTIDNSFTFYNHIIRAGFSTTGRTIDFGIGARVHHIKYYLLQNDYVADERRHVKEEWSEVTLSLGLGFPFSGGRIQYLGLLAMGAGQPGVAYPMRGVGDITTESDFLIAPSGPLSLNEALVGTHQVSLIIDLQ